MAGKISFAFLNDNDGGDLDHRSDRHRPEGVAIDSGTQQDLLGATRTQHDLDSPTSTGSVAAVTPTAGASRRWSVVGSQSTSSTVGSIGQTGEAQIAFANLDGSGGGKHLYLTDSPSSKRVADPRSSNRRAGTPPTVTGASVAPPCSYVRRACGGRDLLRSLLYQAPQNFSFAWPKNGVADCRSNVEHDHGNIRRTYGCHVTATNFAGSTTQTSGGFPVAPSNSTNASASGSAVGATASLKVTCQGIAGQTCTGPILVTAHEKKKGKKIVGVTARKRKGKTTTKQVTVANGSYNLPANHTVTVKVTLNHTGKQLLLHSRHFGRRSAFLRAAARRATLTFRYPEIRINAHLLNWHVFVHSFTTASSLIISPIPAGSTVQIACSGGGCPFSRHTAKPRHSQLSVTKLFGKHHLRPSATVKFTITAPNHIGEVLTYPLRALPMLPKPTVRCLAPGSKRTIKC